MTACGSGDRPLDQVDADSVPAHPTYEQVFAIVDRECIPCHENGESEGEDYAVSKSPGPAFLEDDAPDLSDCTSIVAQRDGIWDTIAANTMPPGAWPRLTSEERLLIRRWIDDGAPAPCNVVAPNRVIR
jgi:uncharacterized membrane protein